MKDMPPRYPSFLRPEDTKNAMPKTMERALDHLRSRLTGADMEWWTSFIARKREKREMWEMTKREYSEAVESFDINALYFKPLSPDQDVEDEDLLQAEAAIVQQLRACPCENRPLKFWR